jgi:hypothetical protein
MENYSADIIDLINRYKAYEPKIHTIPNMLKTKNWKMLKFLLRHEKFSQTQLNKCVDICIDNDDWETFYDLEKKTDIAFNHFYVFRKAFDKHNFTALKKLFDIYLARYGDDADDLEIFEGDFEKQLIEIYRFVFRHNITMPNWRAKLAREACRFDLPRLAREVYMPRDISDNIGILKKIKPTGVLQFYSEMSVLRFYRKKLSL